MSTTTTNFVITKAMLQDYCRRGYTASEMATEITAASGNKCSEGKVKAACKHYEINLRTKPKKNGFVFEPVEKKVNTTPVSDNSGPTASVATVSTGTLGQPELFDAIVSMVEDENESKSEEEKFLNPKGAVTL